MKALQFATGLRSTGSCPPVRDVTGCVAGVVRSVAGAVVSQHISYTDAAVVKPGVGAEGTSQTPPRTIHFVHLCHVAFPPSPSHLTAHDCNSNRQVVILAVAGSSPVSHPSRWEALFGPPTFCVSSGLRSRLVQRTARSNATTLQRWLRCRHTVTPR
jgi:hypothetical protein